MRVRFQADADLREPIVIAVKRREPAVDFQTAIAANLEGLSDPEVLAIAAREGRILVSHDRRTMPQYFGEFILAHAKPWTDHCFTAPAHFLSHGGIGDDLGYDGSRRVDQSD